MIAKLKATKGGNSDIGDDAKSIKFMIFKNQLVMARDLLQKNFVIVTHRNFIERSERLTMTKPNSTVALHSVKIIDYGSDVPVEYTPSKR